MYKFNYVSLSVGDMAARWRMLVVRGVAAVLFGTLTLITPKISLLALVMLWGAYALVDGVSNLVLATRGARAGFRWGWLAFEGVVSIAAGVVTFVWPGITAIALLALIAAWAVVTGIAEIAAAVWLRREIRGEWLLATSGVLSIAFGVLLIVYPRSGALALAWLIGAYAVAFGALLISLGVRLKRWHRAEERSFPTGGAPLPG